MYIWCSSMKAMRSLHIRKYILYFTQCTGVAVENIHNTNWCCYMYENPIKVNPGNDVILNKPNISTECENSGYDIKSSCKGCLPGYNIEQNCSGCLPGYDADKNCDECLFGYNSTTDCAECINGYWVGEYVLHGNPSPTQFDITFQGPLCSQISGL